MATIGTEQKLEEAKTIFSSNPTRAEAIYKEILSAPVASENPEELKNQETALVKLGELYRDQQ